MSNSRPPEKGVLHRAIERQHSDSARLAIARGADVNVVHAIQPYVQHTDSVILVDATPLHAAIYAQYGWVNMEILKLLLDQPGIDVNRVADGITPLGRACMLHRSRGSSQGRNYLDVVRVLLQAPNIDVSKGCVRDGDEQCSALHLAVGSTELISLLLGAEGVDVNCLSSHGLSPLQRACSYESVNSARVLVRAKGIDLNQFSSPCPSPLHYASQSERSELLTILLEAPCARGQDRLLLSHEKYCRSIEEYSPTYDTDPGTPLWWAIVNAEFENAELLLSDKRMDIRQEFDAFDLAIEDARIDFLATFLKRARQDILIGRSKAGAIARALNDDVAKNNIAPFAGLFVDQIVVTQDVIDTVKWSWIDYDERCEALKLLKDFVAEFDDVSKFNFLGGKKRKREYARIIPPFRRD